MFELEFQILKHLFKIDDFFRKIILYIDKNFFEDETNKIIISKIISFYKEFNKIPTIFDIKKSIEIDNNIDIKETDLVLERLKAIEDDNEILTQEFIEKETEKYFQDKALEISILDSVELLKNEKNRELRNRIKENISHALALRFNSDLGHDYFKNALERFNFYNENENLYKCDIDLINEAVGNGFRKKSIYLFFGRTGVGKTLWLCHLATSFLKQNLNVVYFTAEITEELIARRIDANLLDINYHDLGKDKKIFFNRLRNIYEKCKSSLKIKEFPTGSANVNHIKAFLNELKIKENYIPDIIIIDYLNIFSSCRLPNSATLQTYIYFKSVAEEFRALAMETNTVVITGSQTKREGSSIKKVDVDYTDISDSFGVPMTLDWMGAIISNDELFEQNKYLLKVVKTRFSSNVFKVYTIGFNMEKMRLINLTEEEQNIPEYIKDRIRQKRYFEENNDEDFFE